MSVWGAAILGVMGGLVVGLWWGRHVWGPKWFDTSEGIDRKFRNMKDF